VVAFGLMSLLAVSVIIEPFLLERQRRIQASWPKVRGKGIDTRMLRHRLSGTSRPFTEYVGECEVQYNVAEKNYYVWTPFGSSFTDPDPQFISDLRRSCVESSFVVRYKPSGRIRGCGRPSGPLNPRPVLAGSFSMGQIP
jgi:hypothetical protein